MGDPLTKTSFATHVHDVVGLSDGGATASVVDAHIDLATSDPEEQTALHVLATSLRDAPVARVRRQGRARWVIDRRRGSGQGPSPTGPPSPSASGPAVAARSGRRATARRASRRRATARQRKGDLEARIVTYLTHHPHSTTRVIAKGLNVDRGAISAGLLHLVRAGVITKDHATR